jgi:hypothetical protein
MKKRLNFPLSIALFFFFSCSSSESSERKDSTVVSQKLQAGLEFQWDIQLISTTGNLDEKNTSVVKLIVKRGNLRDTLLIGKFNSPLQVADTVSSAWAEAPEKTIAVLTGWWAGAGDHIFLVDEGGGNYLIKWQEVDEESGSLPVKDFQKITIPIHSDWVPVQIEIAEKDTRC